MEKILATLLILTLTGVSVVGSVKSVTNSFLENAELLFKFHQKTIASPGNYICVRDGYGDGTVYINWYNPYLSGGSISIDGFDYVFPGYQHG